MVSVSVLTAQENALKQKFEAMVGPLASSGSQILAAGTRRPGIDHDQNSSLAIPFSTLTSGRKKVIANSTLQNNGNPNGLVLGPGGRWMVPGGPRPRNSTSGGGSCPGGGTILQAHVCCVLSEEQIAPILAILRQDLKFRNVRNWIYAYRIRNRSPGDDIHGPAISTGYDDGGEQGAGGKLLNLLSDSLQLENLLVIVTRWDSGVTGRLGARLYSFINALCKELLQDVRRAIQEALPPEDLAPLAAHSEPQKSEHGALDHNINGLPDYSDAEPKHAALEPAPEASTYIIDHATGEVLGTTDQNGNQSPLVQGSSPADDSDLTNSLMRPFAPQKPHRHAAYVSVRAQREGHQNVHNPNARNVLGAEHTGFIEVTSIKLGSNPQTGGGWGASAGRTAAMPRVGELGGQGDEHRVHFMVRNQHHDEQDRNLGIYTDEAEELDVRGGGRRGGGAGPFDDDQGVHLKNGWNSDHENIANGSRSFFITAQEQDQYLGINHNLNRTQHHTTTPTAGGGRGSSFGQSSSRGGIRPQQQGLVPPGGSGWVNVKQRPGAAGRNPPQHATPSSSRGRGTGRGVARPASASDRSRSSSSSSVGRSGSQAPLPHDHHEDPRQARDGLDLDQHGPHQRHTSYIAKNMTEFNPPDLESCSPFFNEKEWREILLKKRRQEAYGPDRFSAGGVVGGGAVRSRPVSCAYNAGGQTRGSSSGVVVGTHRMLIEMDASISFSKHMDQNMAQLLQTLSHSHIIAGTHPPEPSQRARAWWPQHRRGGTGTATPSGWSGTGTCTMSFA
eukprot:g2652.t1